MVEGRILRYLASVGMIEEVGEDEWAATNITKTLSVPGLKAGIYHKYRLPSRERDEIF